MWYDIIFKIDVLTLISVHLNYLPLIISYLN